MIDEKKLIEELNKSNDNQTHKSYEYLDGYISGWNEVVDVINNQPKVGGWIPCEVDMPKEHDETRDIYDAFTLAFEDTKHFMASDLVQVTAIDESGNIFVADDCTENGKWVNFNEESFDVVAWMPLPIPYKEKESEEE